MRITIEGLVMDKDEEPVKNAIIRIVGNDGSNQKEVARDDGSFSFALQRGVKYVMLAGAKGYLNQNRNSLPTLRWKTRIIGWSSFCRQSANHRWLKHILRLRQGRPEAGVENGSQRADCRAARQSQRDNRNGFSH